MIPPPLRSRQLIEDCSTRRRAVVLPAFETPSKVSLEEGRGVALKAVEAGKQGLAPLISSGKLQGFASIVYPKGHACTDYNKW